MRTSFLKLRQPTLLDSARLHLSYPFMTTLMVLALVAGAAALSDPWKDKDYKAWTNDEVQKVLFDSPWVKMVEVGAPWLKGPTHYLTPLPVDCNGRPQFDRDRTPTSWALGSNESIIIYQTTWQSAHTIRAAKLRQAVLCEKANAERGAEMLEEEPDQYVIVVNSPDMTPFEAMDEDTLAKNSWFLLKKSQKKIAPESVKLQAYGKRIFSVTFSFPRKNEAGQPLITSDEKEVEFGFQSGKFKLKARFELQKMIAKDHLDL